MYRILIPYLSVYFVYTEYVQNIDLYLFYIFLYTEYIQNINSISFLCIFCIIRICTEYVQNIDFISFLYILYIQNMYRILILYIITRYENFWTYSEHILVK